MPIKKELTAAEIGHYGERHVTAGLTANGFACYRNTQQPGATDIDAVGNPTSLYVQVKTAVYPNSPAGLSAEERKGIIARATYNKRQAWLAQVVIDGDGNLVGSIKWIQLS